MSERNLIKQEDLRKRFELERKDDIAVVTEEEYIQWLERKLSLAITTFVTLLNEVELHLMSDLSDGSDEDEYGEEE